MDVGHRRRCLRHSVLPCWVVPPRLPGGARVRLEGRVALVGNIVTWGTQPDGRGGFRLLETLGASPERGWRSGKQHPGCCRCAGATFWTGRRHAHATCPTDRTRMAAAVSSSKPSGWQRLEALDLWPPDQLTCGLFQHGRGARGGQAGQPPSNAGLLHWSRGFLAVKSPQACRGRAHPSQVRHSQHHICRRTTGSPCWSPLLYNRTSLCLVFVYPSQASNRLARVGPGLATRAPPSWASGTSGPPRRCRRTCHKATPSPLSRSAPCTTTRCPSTRWVASPLCHHIHVGKGRAVTRVGASPPSRSGAPVCMATLPELALGSAALGLKQCHRAPA